MGIFTCKTFTCENLRYIIIYVTSYIWKDQEFCELIIIRSFITTGMCCIQQVAYYKKDAVQECAFSYLYLLLSWTAPKGNARVPGYKRKLVPFLWILIAVAGHRLSHFCENLFLRRDSKGNGAGNPSRADLDENSDGTKYEAREYGWVLVFRNSFNWRGTWLNSRIKINSTAAAAALLLPRNRSL